MTGFEVSFYLIDILVFSYQFHLFLFRKVVHVVQIRSETTISVNFLKKTYFESTVTENRIFPMKIRLMVVFSSKFQFNKAFGTSIFFLNGNFLSFLTGKLHLVLTICLI